MFRNKLCSLFSLSTLKRCISSGPALTSPASTSPLIALVIRSFDNPHFGGLTGDTKRMGLPASRVLYTVLRSPHVDKKSREQFELKIKKQYLVIKTKTHELRNKLFWLKRQRIFGAQYEVRLNCKTRLDKGKLLGVGVRSFSSHSEALDRDSGRSIGILSALISMDGQTVDGRNIRVSLANERPAAGNNYGGRSGGGHGGGRED